MYTESSCTPLTYIIPSLANTTYCHKMFQLLRNGRKRLGIDGTGDGGRERGRASDGNRWKQMEEGRDEVNGR